MLAFASTDAWDLLKVTTRDIFHGVEGDDGPSLSTCFKKAY
jgi:hypothetical protein